MKALLKLFKFMYYILNPNAQVSVNCFIVYFIKQLFQHLLYTNTSTMYVYSKLQRDE